MPSPSTIAEPANSVRRRVSVGGLGDYRLRERVTQWLFLVPALVYLLLFFGYPAATNVAMSVEHYTTTTFLTAFDKSPTSCLR